jgi:hypothetical protein
VGSGKSCTSTSTGSPDGRHSTHHGVVADQFLFLGIDRDDRLAGGQVLAGLLVEVPKLRVPIRVLGTLEGLAGALQPIPLLLEQPADGVV